MNMWRQKHRITHWLRRLFAVLSLVASWGAQAGMMVDYAAPAAIKWCDFYPSNCIYDSDLAAAQAMANESTSWWYGGSLVVLNCDGYGHCNVKHCGIASCTPPDYQRISIKVICPVPIIYPTIPYAYEGASPALRSQMCTRIVPSTLTITLTGGSEVEPSNGSTTNTLPFIATVIDQNTGQPTTNPVNVHISLKVDPTSGGHDHGDSTRPRGGIAEVQTCTSDAECWSNPTANGAVVFNFNPTDASGTHTITATCDGCSNTATAPVNVKVKEADAADWGSLTASPDYAMVGGDAGKTHHDNHYLTATARDHLQKLVNKYNTKYPQGPVLYLNDSSLVWGGRFDISGKWAGDHKNHRRGVVIDIRANQDPTAIPQARFTKFERLAAESSAYADLHCAFSGRYVCPACLLDTGPNRHYHVRLLGKSIDK